MQRTHILLFALIFLATSSSAAVLKKVIVDDDFQARCLDGSYGAYYISQGTLTDKFVIYFEGGGWCFNRSAGGTIEDCYARSKTNLGSSLNYPDTVTQNDGILSDNVHSAFANYTKAFFRYCDGSGHQGTRSVPISYKGVELYFRGANLTKSKLAHLQKNHGLFSKAKQIMVTGGSAGGLATFLWADYIKNNTNPDAYVYAVPDSGIFLNAPNFNSNINQYSSDFQSLFRISNIESDPPVPGCIEAHPNNRFKCMFAQNLFPFISTPLFPVQSFYDSWSIPNILGIGCISGGSLASCTEAQRAFIQQYHKNTSQVMTSIGSRSINGGWGISCVNHVYMGGALYSANFQVPASSNNTINAALASWVNKQATSHLHLDPVPWPVNAPCSGVHLQFENQ